MASGPITSRQIDGITMETVTDFIFLGSKITTDGRVHPEAAGGGPVGIILTKPHILSDLGPGP